MIPAYRVNGTVRVEKGHLIQGQVPVCFSTVAPPPCQARPLTVLGNGHLTHLTPSEAKKRGEQALAAYRASVSHRSGDTGNSGNSGSGTSANSGNSGNSGSGNSGTSTPTATQAPLPGATWVVGCYVHAPVKQQPNAGNSGNSGNSGTSGNS